MENGKWKTKHQQQPKPKRIETIEMNATNCKMICVHDSSMPNGKSENVNMKIVYEKR